MMRKVAAIALTVGALTVMPARAADERYARELEPRLQEFIERQQIPGLSIAIVKDGRVVYAKGFGWLSLEHSKGRVTPLTVFHMASIVKPFVATAILQLEEKKKIDLDAPVVHYLPYFKLADDRYQHSTSDGGAHIGHARCSRL